MSSNRELWIEKSKHYIDNVAIIREENGKQLLDLPDFTHHCLVGRRHVIVITTDGKITGSITPSEEINNLNIDSFHPLPDNDRNVLLMTTNKSLYLCSIEFYGKMEIAKLVSHNVEWFSVLYGRKMFNQSKFWRHVGSRFRILCRLPWNKLTIVDVSGIEETVRTNLNINEPIKRLERVEWEYSGYTHKYEAILIITQSNKIMIVDTKLRLLAQIPDMLDVARMNCYWLVMRPNGKFTVIATKKDGREQHRIESVHDGRHYSTPRLPGRNKLLEDGGVFEYQQDIKFVKFLSDDKLLSEDGSVYKYEHNIHTGKTTFTKLDSV